MKIHVACGDVYLGGYINIDVQGIYAKDLKIKNPNETTIDNYFKYPWGSPRREVIVDKKMSITLPWDFKDNSIDTIIMVSTLEHLTKEEALFVISEIGRVSKKGARLLISVPNIEETVRQYIEKDVDWCMRLIYCHGRNQYSLHKYGYTFKSLSSLLRDKWKNIGLSCIINHEYPMIQILAEKK